nr:unnamed protein product [Callosobruchus analis]
MIKPTDSGSLYFNYKKYFCFILLAICDSNYMFTFVDIGSYGRYCDSSIFEKCAFYKKLQQKSLNIPSARQIQDGDEACLSQNVLRPYTGNHLGNTKRIFNYRLSRARRYIECSSGILANEGRIFPRPCIC